MLANNLRIGVVSPYWRSQNLSRFCQVISGVVLCNQAVLCWCRQLTIHLCVFLFIDSNPDHFQDVVLPWAQVRKLARDRRVAATLDKCMLRKTILEESDVIKNQEGKASQKQKDARP